MILIKVMTKEELTELMDIFSTKNIHWKDGARPRDYIPDYMPVCIYLDCNRITCSSLEYSLNLGKIYDEYPSFSLSEYKRIIATPKSVPNLNSLLIKAIKNIK